jgi:signal transduction histidine kinase
MNRHTDWRRYCTPLNLAGYVAWTAVLLATLQMGLPNSQFLGIPLRTFAIAALLMFLAGFVAATTRVDALDFTQSFVGIAIMFVAATLLFVAGVFDTSPILLVLLASVTTTILAARTALLISVVANAILLTALLQHRSVADALLITLIFAGFQAFAAFASYAIRQATESAMALQEVNAHLMTTRSLLSESARDSERLRLSRELHDVAGHKLTALKINLALLAQDPTLVSRSEFAAVRTLADELLGELRGVVSQLRRHDGIDLTDALTKLATLLPSPRVRVESDPEARVDDADRAETLLRIAQESITNAARHAGAENVQVRLTRDGEVLELMVQDDGKPPSRLTAGHGIAGMRERVAALGGSIEFGAGEWGGMRVRARIPRVRPA